jgi:hypothetical protein
VELDRLQHDGPTVCVIAQQPSSITLISLGFHSRMEKFDTLFKMLLFNIYLFI